MFEYFITYLCSDWSWTVVDVRRITDRLTVALNSLQVLSDWLTHAD